jgi:hypothetical protein
MTPILLSLKELGDLEMKFGKRFRFKLQNLQENRYVEYETDLPGSKAIWYWDFSKQETHQFDQRMGVKCTGWASSIYKIAIGNRCLDS